LTSPPLGKPIDLTSSPSTSSLT